MFITHPSRLAIHVAAFPRQPWALTAHVTSERAGRPGRNGPVDAMARLGREREETLQRIEQLCGPEYAATFKRERQTAPGRDGDRGGGS
jgi:hypothetical protein